MLWVLGQAVAGGDRQPIAECKMQWSIPLSAQMLEHKRDHGQMLIDVLQEACPELVGFVEKMRGGETFCLPGGLLKTLR